MENMTVEEIQQELKQIQDKLAVLFERRVLLNDKLSKDSFKDQTGKYFHLADNEHFTTYFHVTGCEKEKLRHVGDTIIKQTDDEFTVEKGEIYYSLFFTQQNMREITKEEWDRVANQVRELAKSL